MQHFICTGGCDGVSDKPGNCAASDCAKYGQPLVPCDCGDGLHADFLKVCTKCGKLCGGNCDLEPFKPELQN